MPYLFSLGSGTPAKSKIKHPMSRIRIQWDTTVAGAAFGDAPWRGASRKMGATRWCRNSVRLLAETAAVEPPNV